MLASCSTDMTTHHMQTSLQYPGLARVVMLTPQIETCISGVLEGKQATDGRISGASAMGYHLAAGLDGPGTGSSSLPPLAIDGDRESLHGWTHVEITCSRCPPQLECVICMLRRQATSMRSRHGRPTWRGATDWPRGHRRSASWWCASACDLLTQRLQRTCTACLQHCGRHSA